jgi:hypothetical protein
MEKIDHGRNHDHSTTDANKTTDESGQQAYQGQQKKGGDAHLMREKGFHDFLRYSQ